MADVEEVVVVSTADLAEEEEAWLRERVRLVRRENYGYDFLSYAKGLEAAGDLYPVRRGRHLQRQLRRAAAAVPRRVRRDGAARRRLLGPDPLRPRGAAPAELLRRVPPLGRGVRGLHRVLVADDPAVRPTPGHPPVRGRAHHHLAGAGFSWASFYEESEADRGLARRRVRWWAAHRVGLRPSRGHPDPAQPAGGGGLEPGDRPRRREPGRGGSPTSRSTPCATTPTGSGRVACSTGARTASRSTSTACVSGSTARPCTTRPARTRCCDARPRRCVRSPRP